MTAAAALERIRRARCPFRDDGGCAASWALAMGGRIPPEERERRYCPSCALRAAVPADAVVLVLTRAEADALDQAAGNVLSYPDALEAIFPSAGGRRCALRAGQKLLDARVAGRRK